MIARLAERHGRTPAQVVLRWHLQLGNVVIPKSVTPRRIEENFAVFDFELTADDIREMAALETGERIGPDPDVVGEKPSGFSTKMIPRSRNSAAGGRARDDRGRHLRPRPGAKLRAAPSVVTWLQQTHA